MSKLESKPIYIKNAKIDTILFEKLCYYFSLDHTASFTAKKVGLSRQTINTYYKIFRDFLFLAHDYFEDSTCTIHCIKLQNQYHCYIEKENKYIFLNQHNISLHHLQTFLNRHSKQNFFEQKKSNALRIGFNKFKKEYFIFAYFNSNNQLNGYIEKRLKKFRGINKNNIERYLCESIYRFQYTQKSLYSHLMQSFTLV